MNAIVFLQNKGILAKDKTKWIVTFEDGRDYDIVQLLNEYKSIDGLGLSKAEKEFNELIRRRDAIVSDLMSDDFHEYLGKFKADATKFFNDNPEFNNGQYRQVLGMG